MRTAILLPNWVGDACMATPTIRAIRQGMPEISELCLVGRYAPTAVLDGLPWVDGSIVYKPKSRSSETLSRRGMIAELKQRKFDMIVLLPNSLSAGLIGYFSGAKRRVGYAKDGRSWLLTDPISLSDGEMDYRTEPTIRYYLNIAKHLGCEANDPSMFLTVSDGDRHKADAMLERWGFRRERPTVLFNTTSATGTARFWPIGQASRAALLLAKEHGIQVIIHSGPGDRERSNAIAFGASHPLVRSMGQVEDIPLGLSKAVIEQASVVLSSDSGPRHIAAALNRPLVSLFGPTSPAQTETYNLPETVVNVSMSCSPCGKTKCPLVHNNCMHAITHTRVVDAILMRLGQVPKRRLQPSLPIAA